MKNKYTYKSITIIRKDRIQVKDEVIHILARPAWHVFFPGDEVVIFKFLSAAKKAIDERLKK